MDIVHNNYVFKVLVLILIFPIYFLVLTFLAPLINITLVPNILANRKSNTHYYKKHYFFEILHFHGIDREVFKKFVRFSINASICLGVILLLSVFLYIHDYLTEAEYKILVYLCVAGCILSILLYSIFIGYKAILKDRGYEDYYLISRFKTIKKYSMFFSLSIIMIFLILYYSSDLINFTAARINQHYSEKFMQEVSDLKKAASDQEIDDLIYFFDNNRYADHIEIVFLNISNGLKIGDVNLYNSLNNFEELEQIFNYTGLDMRDIAINNWQYWSLSIFGVPGILYLVAYLPIILARKKRPKKKTFV